MKKLLLTLAVILLSATGLKAATLYYTATEIACSINNSQWSDWYSLGCSFVIDQDSKQVKIYSDVNYSTSTNKFSINRSSIQTIDFGDVNTSYGTNNQGYNYRLETLEGNDKYGSNCRLYFLVFDDGDLMFMVAYANISYKYMLKRR